MCILCVASRWSRRIVTMLPWLIIPLLCLWALSQLLPPGFRFEVTAPRLACVGVLLFSLGWYELLMPRLSEWRARRSLLMHERRKMAAQEAAKWRKEAIRKCRNCFMAYKEQKPVGGRFMCTYCGHLSKRPALDVPGGTAGGVGLGQFICGRKDEQQSGKSWTQRVFENEVWLGGEGCFVGGQYSGVVIVFRLASFVGYCLWLVCSKVWKGGMSEGNRLRTERKAGQRKGEGGGGGGQESKAEKMKRKAEEKRLARLEKEQMEAEERMQREEVARLVDERRRQRADAQKDNECVEEYEPQRRSVDKGKDSGGKTKSPVEEDAARKNKEKGKKDRKPPEDSSKAVVKPVEVVVKNEGIYSASKGGGVKAPAAPINNPMTTVKPVAAYSKHLKGRTSSLLTLKKEKPPLNAGVNPAPVGKVGSTEGAAAVSKPSAWNRISWAWGKGAATRTNPSLNLDEESNLRMQTVPCKEPERAPQVTPTSPILSPAKITSSPNKPADMPPVIDLSLSQPPAPEDHQSPTSASTSPPMHDSETLFNSAVTPPPFDSSDSVYSAFMPPVDTVPVSSSPAYDRWGIDFSKSTWKMWEAPNLELPRLTQSLAKDGRSLHPPVASPELPSSILSLNQPPAAAAAATLPGLPISNNIWSNYHAFESTRRIWEGDLPSEAPPPPEFVDCITQEVMQDPVIAADGHSYERSAIEKWLKTHDTSPKTGGVLPPLGSSGSGVDKSLRPNHNLRGQIIEYKECIQRGGLPPANNGWQAPTEAVKKSRIGSLYSSPGGGSVWAYSSSS